MELTDVAKFDFFAVAMPMTPLKNEFSTAISFSIRNKGSVVEQPAYLAFQRTASVSRLNDRTIMQKPVLDYSLPPIIICLWDG